jgi:fermentation-respiration switch protein FrsA (DUF1100 family)
MQGQNRIRTGLRIAWNATNARARGMHHNRLTFDKFRPDSIANWRSPVLFVHGDDDRNVPIQQTTDLVEKLRAQNVAFEELIVRIGLNAASQPVHARSPGWSRIVRCYGDPINSARVRASES